MEINQQKTKTYYNQETKNYVQMYKKNYSEYPANLIRLNIIINRLKQSKIKTILDCGCGSCGPLIKLLQLGYKVCGFDFSEKMITEGKKELLKNGFNPQLIFNVDLENKKNLPNKKFDAILALGVFPHISNEKKVLSYIYQMLNKKGKVFISFRNDIFASYTFNKYSYDFFVNKVINLKSLPKTISKEVINFYTQKLDVKLTEQKNKNKILYSDLVTKFHNPLNIEKELFKPCNFSIVDIHFYHYHALPPIFENKYPQLFRKLSLKIENPNDWKGNLMASAYVVEAIKND